MKGALISGAVVALAGCAATPAPDAAGPPRAACNADALPPFVGRKADAETGAEMMVASGARSLRWVAPGMAVTMDYREDRLTISYDKDMIIERVACG